ncbi:MAG: tRNA 5'-guanylyltransferase [Methanoregulaceae archaeon]|nr:tRNA 5'-guanylyltransferase [Methanoregulaceae archaeon]
MRDREIFSGLVSAPPVYIRLDGRAFHQVATRLGLTRPFDTRFSEAMALVCEQLMRVSGLSPVFCFTFSDEISIYLSRLPFGGRVEKLDSVAASFASSALTIALGGMGPLSFDARIVQVTPKLALEYLVGRQQETWRNHMNSYAQDALVADGFTMREAAEKLKGISSPGIHELLFARGVNLAKTPAWQRRGILVYHRKERVGGENPLSGEHVEAVRSRIFVDREPPVFYTQEGKDLICSLIGSF